MDDWWFRICGPIIGAGIYVAFKSWKQEQQKRLDQPRPEPMRGPNDPPWPFLKRKSRPGDPPLIG
jgi:hypothetical protein